MLRGHIFKIRALHRGKDLTGAKSCRHHRFGAECLRQNIGFPVFCLCKHVILHGIERDRLVSGKRPCGGGPDHEVGLGKIAKSRKLSLIVLYRELDVDRGAGIGLILDLCLCQRGLVVRTPINGLHSLIDVALAIHLTEHLDLSCLELAVHRQIGILPIGGHAESLKLTHLTLHEILREGVARGAKLGNGHLLAVQLALFDDRGLDGHSVVIPAGSEGNVIARHLLGLVDEILEDLVHCGPHVDISVREGGAVVEHEQRLALAALLHLFVELDRIPIFHHIGLSLRQICTHREFGCGQIQCGRIILCHFFYLLFFLCFFKIMNRKSKKRLIASL